MIELQWKQDLLFRDVPDEDTFSLNVSLADMETGRCDAHDGLSVNKQRTLGALSDFISDMMGCGFSVSHETNPETVSIRYTFKFR